MTFLKTLLKFGHDMLIFRFIKDAEVKEVQVEFLFSGM